MVDPAGVEPVAGSELHRMLTRLIRACDVVFGTASIVLAVIATWYVVAGGAPLGLAIALWAVPALNITFSLVTKSWNRISADSLRGVACAPLAAYCYVIDPAGLLRHLWLPAMMISVAVELTVCIGERRARSGIAIAALYAVSIAVASLLHDCSIDSMWVRDSVGLLISGTIISVVAGYLGEALETATQQRNRAETTLAQLTIAIDSLHTEMERRAAVEEELHHAQKLESVGRLAAGIAHEINTPVQFVGDSLHFVSDAVADLFAIVRGEKSASDDLPYLSEEVPKALALAEDGLGRVATIVRSMKMFAHPDSQTMQPTNLNRALEATLVVATNEFKYVADLVTDFGDLPPVTCFGSEINQVVLNLVVNAAHAITDAGATEKKRGTLHVTTYRDGDDAIITIRDTGTGIPETVRHRIFDPFFTTKEVGRGTGQGLSIARQIIVDKHRGKLTFETELGVGTTFRIALPIKATLAMAV